MEHAEKTVNLDYTHLDFYDGYVISRVKENVVFDQPELEQVQLICDEHFRKKPYVYISQRVHSYNVNPMVYISMKKRNSFSGIAIVSDDFSSRTTAEFEKRFAPLPFDIFSDVEEAVAWAKDLVK